MAKKMLLNILLLLSIFLLVGGTAAQETERVNMPTINDGGMFNDGDISIDMISQDANFTVMNEKIAARGANWKAGKTSVSELSEKEKKQMCGARVGPIPENARFAQPLAGVTYDASFDWRNKDGKDWVTPVRNQGSCGSCWAFSALGATEAAINIYANDPDKDIDLSEQHLVSDCCNAGSCSGGWPNSALGYVRDMGVSDESCFPYTMSNSACTPCSDWEENSWKIEDYVYVYSSTDAFKSALQKYGPISVILSVPDDWFYYSGGIYEPTWSFSDGVGWANHAVVLTGWNDSEGCWIIKNSWGTGWGEQGYGKVLYGNLEKYNYAYAVTGIVDNDDDIPPSVITDLVTADVTYSSIDLGWTAVGDDGLNGTASVYDIRYSTSEITDLNWNSVTQVIGESKPNPSGFTESFTVENLEFGTTYHFTIKAIDNAGNTGGLSNIVSENTTTPTIAFSDDMESGLGWIPNGLWHHETYKSSSPVSSWAYNLGGPYTYNTGSTNSGSLTSPIIDLTNFSSATLAFETFYQTESTGTLWDQRKIQIGVDGVFIEVDQLSGDPMMEWNAYATDISSYAGKNVQIRFFFDTVDGYINDYEGWYIDDILIFGEKENVPPVANAGPDQISFVGKPVVFNGSESFDPDGNVASLEWDFGDGTSASGVVVSHSYSVDGNYTVTLNVTDNGGATATDTASVEAIATDVVTITKAQYANYKNENKERTLYLQATSSCEGEAVLEAYRTSDNFYYGEMVYNIDRNLFILTVYDNITVNPGEITVTSLLGGYDIKEVTSKFKNN